MIPPIYVQITPDMKNIRTDAMNKSGVRFFRIHSIPIIIIGKTIAAFRNVPCALATTTIQPEKA